MNILDDWPNNWFGIWREQRVNHSLCPKISDFIAPWSYNDDILEKIVFYLENCPIIATTSGSSFVDPFTGQKQGGSISVRTDGVWQWLDDLSRYVKFNGVKIPNRWLDYMTKNEFQVPLEINEEHIASLDRPPL
jgi:hypothetical protein